MEELHINFSFFIYTLLSRPAIETTILRTPGLLYQENAGDIISNVYKEIRMAKLIYAIGVFLVVLFGVIFALLNAESVQLNYYFE